MMDYLLIPLLSGMFSALTTFITMVLYRAYLTYTVMKMTKKAFDEATVKVTVNTDKGPTTPTGSYRTKH